MKTFENSGVLPAQQTLEVLSYWIHSQIQFHEKQLESVTSEEDIKQRERSIKKLQAELQELRHSLTCSDSPTGVTLRTQVVSQ